VYTDTACQKYTVSGNGESCARCRFRKVDCSFGARGGVSSSGTAQIRRVDELDDKNEDGPAEKGVESASRSLVRVNAQASLEFRCPQVTGVFWETFQRDFNSVSKPRQQTHSQISRIQETDAGAAATPPCSERQTRALPDCRVYTKNGRQQFAKSFGAGCGRCRCLQRSCSFARAAAGSSRSRTIEDSESDWLSDESELSEASFVPDEEDDEDPRDEDFGSFQLESAAHA